MVSRFVIHLHRTGRTHYDLRLLLEGKWRSWSMLREPPAGSDAARLAIERETIEPEKIDAGAFTEEAFGSGRARLWDTGEVEVVPRSEEELSLRFAGRRMAGTYRLSRTRWYPGNRWILKREADAIRPRP